MSSIASAMLRRFGRTGGDTARLDDSVVVVTLSAVSAVVVVVPTLAPFTVSADRLTVSALVSPVPIVATGSDITLLRESTKYSYY